MSVENGREFNIIYTYTDKRGKAWGMIYPSPVQSKAGVTKTAWISLKDFSIKYNQNAFLNEHKDEIQNITVEFDLSEYDTPVILWKVPLAGQIETKIDTTTNYAREYKKQFDSYYIDPYGQKWVEVEMYKGYYNGWICISDPCNEKIKLDDKLQYTLYPVSTPERNRRIMIQKISITVIGVVFVIVICFIVNIWKRKKHSNYKM